jgi:cell volume regulation protein A
MIFNIVFFISLTSVMVQGSTLPLVAKWLKLTIPEKEKQRTQTDIVLDDSIKKVLTEIVVPGNCSAIGKQIVELGLPKTTFISILQRDNKFITPSGSTQLEAADKLFVLTENKDDLSTVFECLEMKKK